MPTPSADDGTRAWLRAVVWSGTLALVLSGVLQAVFPRQMGMLPPGFRTPVLALELARSPAELEEMFGLPRSEQRAQWVAQVDRGNVLDFAFIPVYCFFLYACARAFAPVRPRVARSALVLCVLAAIGDAVENVFLFRITERLGVEYASDVLGLIAFTWLKWFSLVGCLALLSPSMRARGRWGAVSGWVGLASLLFALIAVVIRGVAAELMLLAITLGIVTMWIEAIRSRRGMPGSG